MSRLFLTISCRLRRGCVAGFEGPPNSDLFRQQGHHPLSDLGSWWIGALVYQERPSHQDRDGVLVPLPEHLRSRPRAIIRRRALTPRPPKTRRQRTHRQACRSRFRHHQPHAANPMARLSDRPQRSLPRRLHKRCARPRCSPRSTKPWRRHNSQPPPAVEATASCTAAVCILDTEPKAGRRTAARAGLRLTAPRAAAAAPRPRPHRGRAPSRTISARSQDRAVDRRP